LDLLFHGIRSDLPLRKLSTGILKIPFPRIVKMSADGYLRYLIGDRELRGPAASIQRHHPANDVQHLNGLYICVGLLIGL
jgi:hypothetical protein